MGIGDCTAGSAHLRSHYCPVPFSLEPQRQNRKYVLLALPSTSLLGELSFVMCIMTSCDVTAQLPENYVLFGILLSKMSRGMGISFVILHLHLVLWSGPKQV